MRLLKQLILVLVIGALALTGTWHLHKARTYQLFGTLVPRVKTTQKVVALTFDDGPTPGYGEQILDILRKLDVKATFFVNGRDVEKAPDLTRRMVAAGHELGNHTYSHARMVLQSPAFIRDEIERTDAAIRGAGYAEAIHFRPPYGKKLVALPYYLWRTDRTTITWDIEPETYPEIAADATRITEHVVTKARPGSIILLHVMFGSRAESVKAVAPIITELKAQGYQFVTVSELLALQRK